MENKITVIFCSKKNGEEHKNFIEHIQNSSECDLNVICVHNPDGLSLSKIYADMTTNEQIDTNIIVFIHDDIEFLRKGWGKEILRLFNKYDEYGIIGVAGSAQFDEKAAWWNYEKKYGQVLHRWEGKSWLTAFSPLLDKDLQEVVVIDGLFIALHKKRISENFSRELTHFDFYDIYFCLANYLSKKCKIGVTTNIRIAHNSIGKLRDSWYKNREIIIEKFGNKFPIDLFKDKK
jgi:hypothetical protein